MHLLLVQHFHQTIHRSPWAENLPPCESQRNITRARLEQQTAQTNQAKIYKITKYGPVAQLGAHHIRIVGVVGSNPIRSTRKSREIISFTAFLQLFCKNGGPAAQPFLPYFPYKPPLRSHPLFRTPETIIIFVLRPSGKAEKIWKCEYAAPGRTP